MIKLDYDPYAAPFGPAQPVYLIVPRRLMSMPYWTFENQTMADNIGPMRLHTTNNTNGYGYEASTTV